MISRPKVFAVFAALSLFIGMNAHAQSFEPLVVEFVYTGTANCGAHIQLAMVDNGCNSLPIENLSVPQGNGWTVTYNSPCCRPIHINDVNVNLGSGPTSIEFNACSGDPNSSGVATVLNCNGNPVEISYETLTDHFVRVVIE